VPLRLIVSPCLHLSIFIPSSENTNALRPKRPHGGGRPNPPVLAAPHSRARQKSLIAELEGQVGPRRCCGGAAPTQLPCFAALRLNLRVPCTAAPTVGASDSMRGPGLRQGPAPRLKSPAVSTLRRSLATLIPSLCWKACPNRPCHIINLTSLSHSLIQLFSSPGLLAPELHTLSTPLSPPPHTLHGRTPYPFTAGPGSPVRMRAADRRE
jgi:hypothetical protein